MGSDNRRLTVLVVENEQLLRLSIIDMLQDIGHGVLEATTGGAALKLLAGETPIDVILIDIGLPDMDGRDLAKQVRALRPQMQIVFATGHDSSWVRGLESTVMAAYLPKPYRQTDLERVLYDCVGGPDRIDRVRPPI